MAIIPADLIEVTSRTHPSGWEPAPAVCMLGHPRCYQMLANGRLRVSCPCKNNDPTCELAPHQWRKLERIDLGSSAACLRLARDGGAA